MKKYTNAIVAALLWFSSHALASTLIYEPCLTSQSTFCQIHNLYETTTGTGSLDPRYHVLPTPPPGAVSDAVDHGTVGATVTLDFSASNFHKLTQTAATNLTFTFVDPPSPRMVYINATAPATGTAPQFVWPGTVDSSSGQVPLSLVWASSTATLPFFWDGTKYTYILNDSDLYNARIGYPSFQSQLALIAGPNDGGTFNGQGLLYFSIYNNQDTAEIYTAKNDGFTADAAVYMNRVAPSATAWGTQLGDYSHGSRFPTNNNVIVNGNTFNPDTQMVGSAEYKHGSLGLFNYAGASGNTHGLSALTLARSNGVPQTPTFTALASGDLIGAVSWQGSDGTLTTFAEGARVQAAAQSTWTSSNHDAGLNFYTTPSASTTPTLAVTINDNGSLTLAEVGAGILIKTGSNATAGTAVCNGTTDVVVSNTKVTANTIIMMTENVPGGTPSTPYVSTRTAGTSFSMKCGAADTSTVGWFFVELAP